MDKRLELHEILCRIINMTEPNGDRHTYFQPPESIKMNFPAIVYSRKSINNKYASNSEYIHSIAYKITVIDEDPDSEIVKKVSKLPKCRFEQHFTKDNLNHDIFTLYY